MAGSLAGPDMWGGPQIPSFHPPHTTLLQVRDAVVVMLDAWITVAGSDKLFPAAAEAVANPKCIIDGKILGLHW